MKMNILERPPADNFGFQMKLLYFLQIQKLILRIFNQHILFLPLNITNK